jgi:hypothetical protein
MPATWAGDRAGRGEAEEVRDCEKLWKLCSCVTDGPEAGNAELCCCSAPLLTLMSSFPTSALHASVASNAACNSWLYLAIKHRFPNSYESTSVDCAPLVLYTNTRYDGPFLLSQHSSVFKHAAAPPRNVVVIIDLLALCNTGNVQKALTRDRRTRGRLVPRR